MSVNIGIIGSRRRDSSSDFLAVRSIILKLIDKYESDNIVIVSGGCPKGGDKFAELIAKEFKIKTLIHYPDKSKLDKKLMKTKPKVAYAIINYARNTLIAEDSDILVACVANNIKGGTEDTIKKFEKMNKGKVILV